MDSQLQKQIDEIMYETNEKISAIVNEIRDVRFSKMDENDKQTKCDKLRERLSKSCLKKREK
jgi:hypothetical protein